MPEPIPSAARAYLIPVSQQGPDKSRPSRNNLHPAQQAGHLGPVTSRAGIVESQEQLGIIVRADGDDSSRPRQQRLAAGRLIAGQHGESHVFPAMNQFFQVWPNRPSFPYSAAPSRVWPSRTIVSRASVEPVHWGML